VGVWIFGCRAASLHDPGRFFQVCLGDPTPSRPTCTTSQPRENQLAHACNALADSAFLCSSKTELHTSTHSLQIYTRLERSDGVEISASTWSWVLLQNEHRRTSSSSRRLPNIIRVWRGGSRSQGSQKFTLALLVGAKTLRCSKDIERCCPSQAKDCLPPNIAPIFLGRREFQRQLYRCHW